MTAPVSPLSMPTRSRCDARAGKLANLEKLLAEQPLPVTTFGMGHTRWATHGAPTDRNAHPHLDEAAKVAVVHNGIIENFAALRAELENDGVTLASDTDTEVVSHLLARAFDGDLADAMRSCVPPARGGLHLGGRARRPAGRRRRRPSQLTAGRRQR